MTGAAAAKPIFSTIFFEATKKAKHMTHGKIAERRLIVAVQPTLTGDVTNKVCLPLAGSRAVAAFERPLVGVHSLVSNHLRDPLAHIATRRAGSGRDVRVAFHSLQ